MKIWFTAAFCISAQPAFASAGLTGHYSLSGIKNPESAGVAGISLVKFDGGVGIENSAAIPTQRNRFALYSQKPHSISRSITEKDTSSLYGAQASFAVPNPWAALGMGLGLHRNEQSTVFSANSEGSLEYDRFDTEIGTHLGMLVFDEISIGLGPIFSFGQETVSQASPRQKIESQGFNAWAMRVAAQYRKARFRTAATWQSEANISTQKLLIPRDGGELGKPYKPAQMAFAMGYAIPGMLPRTSLFPLQVDLLGELGITYFPNVNSKIYRSGSRVYQRTYALYVPFYESPTQQPQELDTRPRSTPRIAADIRIFDTRFIRINSSIGTWLEPGMVRGEQEKTHYTSGVELNAWGLKATVAMDQTSSNRSYYFGMGAQYER